MTARSPLIVLILVVGLVGAMAIVGCPGGGTGGGVTADTAKGVLIGQVTALSGQPVANATVTLNNGLSTSTDDNGYYSFTDLSPGAEMVARFRADGFAPTAKGFTINSAGSSTPACVFMADAAQTVTLDADSDSTQRSGDSAVTLGAGSLVDENGNPVSGSVDLTATFLDPSTDGVMAFPGSFGSAQTQTGGDATLESFGFAIYELSQNGSEVNLAPGSTADIEYVLPDNAQGQYNVGDRIPLWEFDEDTATWIEAGEGEVRLATDGSGRLAWFATIDHFSAWNCDAPIEDKNCIAGRVTFGGSPVNGADIAAVGVTYNGTSTSKSSGDGTFCLEVKRGSTVRVEIRLNGSATPISSQEVTVADAPADCISGGCTEMGDVSVDLDACVSGQVLTRDGLPVAGAVVHIVPGQTVTTDGNGTYCGAAASNIEVFVFAEGRPSVAVTTSGTGNCASGGCATADLSLTLPEAGDQVGTLTAAFTVALSNLTGDIESFMLTGSFLIADIDLLGQLGMGAALPGFETETREIGGCTLTTQTFTITADTELDVSGLLNFGGIGALDPGAPGTAGNGSASVQMLPGDPNQFDPPQPSLAGMYAPAETPETLVSMGFDAGQQVTFSFPGGADIGAFQVSVNLPERVNVTSPDLTDPNLSLDLGSPLNVTWAAGGGSETVTVMVLSGSVQIVTNPDGTTAISGLNVIAQCEFPDNGSGTVPTNVLTELPADGAITVTTLTVTRTRQAEVAVPLNRVAGNGVVQVIGQAGVSRALIALPDIPDFNICDFLTCPSGEVCNPTTFQCEPG